MWYIWDVPIVEENHALIATLFTFTSIAFLAVSLRLITRITLTRNLGIDDILITAAMLGSIGFLTAIVFQIKYGLGSGVQLSVIQNFLQALLATIVSYSSTHLLLKFSILLQCKRIFTAPVAQRVFLSLLIWLTAYGLFCWMSSLITCVPIAKYWDPTIPGGCIDRSILHYVLAGFNIVNDVALLVAPLPFLKNLHIARRSKIVLMVVFTCGGFACIVAVIRLNALYINNSAPIEEQPIKGAAIALWSGLEINIGIICASVPAIKGLFTIAFPHFLNSIVGSVKHSRSGRSGVSGGGGGGSGNLPFRSFDRKNPHQLSGSTAKGTENGTTLEIKVQQSFEMRSVDGGRDGDEDEGDANSSQRDLVQREETAWSSRCFVETEREGH